MKRRARALRWENVPHARCIACGVVLELRLGRGGIHSRMPRHGVPVPCAGSRRRIVIYARPLAKGA